MRPYYQDEGVTIYCGDAREILPAVAADVLPHVLVTDPPYGIGWSRNANPRRSSWARAGIPGDEDTTVRDEALAIVAQLPGVVFGSFYAPFPAHTRQVLVWPKPNDAGVVGSTTGFRRDAEPVFIVGPWPVRTVRWSSVLPRGATCISRVASSAGHPHAKPLGLMRHLVERCPEGVVVDPFMGSGTTLRAAKDLGRRAVGIEVEERYCAAAVRRLAQGVLELEAS